MKTIEYYYIYLIKKKFPFKTKNIYIFSVLEDALLTKCIALLTKCISFLFPLKFNYEQKKCKTGRQKPGLFWINSRKIYKKNSEENLNHLKNSATSLLFLNIKKSLCCIVYQKELPTNINYITMLNKPSHEIENIYA